MIPWFLHWLGVQYALKIPAVFSYASTKMFLSSLTAFFLTILLGPFCIRKLYLLKTGQSIRVEDCPMLASLHQKKKETPTMGGMLILFAVIASILLWMDIRSPFSYILIFTVLWLGFIGGIDDYLKMKCKNSKGLKASWKMGLQTVFALLLALYLYCPEVTKAMTFGDFLHMPVAKEYMNSGAVSTLSTQQYMGQYYLPFMKDPALCLTSCSLLIAFFITWLTVTGTSNAVNLTDGLDGLAAGHIVMVSFVLGMIAFLSNHVEMAHYLNILYIEGSSEIATALFALAGASLGFLWYNAYPAQIFMGDTGSLPLGGMLGVSAVLLRREFLLVLVGGIFVAEALSVIIQVASYKLRNRKRVFLCSPLHHHFECKGWPETKVVIRFWIVGIMLAVIALSSLKFQ